MTGTDRVGLLWCRKRRWIFGEFWQETSAGFKLFYHGVDRKRNGVGVILKGVCKKYCGGKKRLSDRVMSVKLDTEGEMLHVGCEEMFWCEMMKWCRASLQVWWTCWSREHRWWNNNAERQVVVFTAVIFIPKANRTLESKMMPDEWRRKGDLQSCGIYRGIKLMNQTMHL